MQTISDVFAFACEDGDRWEILRADPSRDLGMTDEVDIRAFKAAKDHIHESVVALLKATWSACNQRAQRSRTTRFDKIKGREPDRRTLLRELSWERPVVTTKGKELFTGASIEETREGGPLALYAWLRMPEEHMEGWLEAIEGSAIQGGRYEEYYYLPRIEILAGAAINDLAEALAERLWPALQKASKLLSPERRKSSARATTATNAEPRTASARRTRKERG